MSDCMSLQVVTPYNLSEQDIVKIYELEQDMWAREQGLGEYLECRDCGSIFSKQDIYSPENKELYNLTVAEIEREQLGIVLHCCDCGGEMFHRFEKEKYIEEIKKRYSHQAHLALMKRGEVITGFMDGYVGSFDKIYEQELSDHYVNIGKNTIRSHIEDILEKPVPDQLFTCCSMGTREDIMGMRSIYSLLQCFFVNFPKEYEYKLGISELDSGGTLDRIYKSLGSQDIGMTQYRELISCSNGYNSGLFIQENMGEVYKKSFSKDFRRFLRERTI